MMHQLAGKLRSLVTSRQRRPNDPFLALAEDYARRLERWPLPTPPENPLGGIAVLLTPWLSTCVPFFSLECALMLVRAGYRVVLICDFSDLIGNAPDSAHGHAIERLARRLEEAGVAEIVSAGDLPEGEPDFPTADAILQNNAIWRMRGEEKAAQFIENHPDGRERLARHLGRIEPLLRAERFAWLLVPGGVFGLSGVYVAAAHQAGIDFTTYDAGAGVLREAHGAIAAHLGDLPRSFEALRSRLRQNPAEKERVLALAQEEIGDRASGRDFRRFQVTAATGRTDLHYDVIVALNIRWDSAALARQRLFESVRQWLEALLDWAAAHPEVTLCIRQHPRERLDFAKGSDDLQPLLARYSEAGGRIRFIRADEEVNTYDLLSHARVLLPHTSTIGIEAAFLGKPVVLGTTCYYEDFGFVWPAASREEYFARIEQALAGKLTLSSEQQDDAGIAYFLTQKCAFCRSDFNPHPENFQLWKTVPPESIWAQPETADFREAMLSREPLSLVRARRFLHDAN